MGERDKTVDRIADDLLESGLRAGSVAMVHSSLSSMGYVEGGSETVIQGLLRALGPKGTLLMPSLSYEHVGPSQPVFDVRKTPSNVGTIPEFFRLRTGTRRSVNPTHSVCGVGARCDEALSEHWLDDTPVGSHSPFRRVRDMSGQIVFLGCGLTPNTSMHGVEELARPPYLFGDKYEYTIVDEDETERSMVCWHHGFGSYRQRYDRVALLMQMGTQIHRGKVLDAEVWMLEAGAMWEIAAKALERDSLYFVESTRHQS